MSPISTNWEATGQHTYPGGDLPQTLEIMVSNDCGPVENAAITIQPEGAGAGGLDIGRIGYCHTWWRFKFTDRCQRAAGLLLAPRF